MNPAGLHARTCTRASDFSWTPETADKAAPLPASPDGSPDDAGTAAAQDAGAARNPGRAGYVDEREKEMDDSASVWRAYLHEAMAYDQADRTRWMQTLDTLFIFAALFSAVLTTFLVESYQQLQPDPQTSMLAATIETNVLLRALISGSSPPEPTPPISFSPSTADVVVNILWFSGLALSLSVSSLAVLAKSWLNELNMEPSESPRQTSRLRQFRHDGMVRWRLPYVIHSLPLLLMAALMLFMFGLVVFTWEMQSAIPYIILVIGGLTLAVHLASFLLPLFWLDCSYRSPLATFIYRVRRLYDPMAATLLEAESDVVHKRASELDALSISWLVRHAAQATNRQCGLHAVAGMSVSPTTAHVFQRTKIIDRLRTEFASCYRHKELVHPGKADLIARGIMNVHRSRRLFAEAQSDSLRTTDMREVARLHLVPDREVAVVGACAGGFLQDIFDYLDKHIDGDHVLSPFTVQFIVDTIRHEFSYRKGFDQDHWVTDSSWGVWGRRACTSLAQLLDRELADWDNPFHPNQFLVSLVLTTLLFTTGPDAVLVLERLPNKDDETRRRFIPLGLRALNPMLKHTGRYVVQSDLPLVSRAFLRIADCIPTVCTGRQDILQEVIEVLSQVDISAVMDRALEEGNALGTGIGAAEALSTVTMNRNPLNANVLNLVAWQLKTYRDSWARRALCLRLYPLATDPKEAPQLVTSLAFPELLALAQQDISMPDRREAFRVCIFTAATVVRGGRAAYHTLMNTHKFLEFFASYFERPWGLRDDEVRMCLEFLRGVHERTRAFRQHRQALTAALHSMARWPERQWQGYELLFPYRHDVAEFYRSLGLPPVQFEPIIWKRLPRPAIKTRD